MTNKLERSREKLQERIYAKRDCENQLDRLDKQSKPISQELMDTNCEIELLEKSIDMMERDDHIKTLEYHMPGLKSYDAWIIVKGVYEALGGFAKKSEAGLLAAGRKEET